ncbi:MAG TPA: dihydrodipicolinate synthase family protein [Nitrososphaerales archaeon]|nr:dihydrodipicolinate synthase family protein [Nitrososphaerales archaeon]
MALKELKGVFPLMPLVLKKNQDLDLEGLKNNIHTYEEAGVQGYVSFGCMGEFYALNFDEFKQVVDVARNETRKIACVFGTTFHNTRECIIRTKYAEDAGADGVMVGLPYLIPCTEEAAYAHFRAVNDAANDTQIMLYNNPFSFRFNITAEFWDRLMELDRIKAVKESNNEVLHRSRVVSRISKRINVFPGGENWLFGDSLLGANGIVSMAGPGVPKATLEFFDACMKRDIKRAIPYHVKFSNLFRNLTSENEVAWLKACAGFNGLSAGPPRAPYPPLDPASREVLWAELRELNEMAEGSKTSSSIEI